MADKQKVHFIGICGAGMSAAAKLMKDFGYEVTGSDENFYPPVSTQLKKSRIKFFSGYKAKNIPSGVSMIVIGKHAGLTPAKNKEVAAAFKLGAPIKSFPEVLGNLVKERVNIVIAGSCGKSTCAALAAWILEKAGRKPGYFIGAIPETPNKNSTLGKGKFFVLEGDEYPSSNWDARAKFVHYFPAHILLTSLTHDHLNIFQTREDYLRTFKTLIKSLPPFGKLVASVRSAENLGVFLRRIKKSPARYGFGQKAEWRAENIKFGAFVSFDLYRKNKKVTALKTKLLGKHNVENIVGVSALLLSLNAVTVSELQKAITSFKPLTRRLDRKSLKTSIPVFEGFGSSREKAKAAIEAVKLHFPRKKLITIFEPHTFSWRSRRALNWYDDAFCGSEEIFIYKSPELNPARGQLTLKEIVGRVAGRGYKVSGFKETSKGLDIIKKIVKNDNMILILSSGGFGGLLDRLVPWLEARFPAK